MKHKLSRFVTSVVTLLSFIVVLTTSFVSCEESTPVELTPSVTPGTGGGGDNTGGGSEEKPYLTVSPQSLTFAAEGGESKTFTVSSNVTYSVSNKATWIDLTQKGDEWTVTSVANPDEEDREASIVVSSNDLRQEVKVHQAGKSVTYLLGISQDTIQATSAEVSRRLQISGNDTWTVSTVDAWITIAPSRGEGEQEIEIKLTANDQPEARTGTVTIKGDKSKSELKLGVTQFGVGYDFEVAETSFEISSLAASKDITITTNDEWTAASDQNWATPSATEGKGSAKIQLTITENKTTTEREATITLQGKNSQTKHVKVKQAGKYLTLNTESLNFATSADSKKFTVDTDGSFEVSDNASWISTSVNGNEVTVMVTENTNTTTRSGKVTVKLTSLTSGSLEKEVSIYQSATDITAPELSRNTININSASATEYFNITDTNDDWTIESNMSWIEVSPSSGSGNRSNIAVTISENRTPDSRSGKITVRGVKSQVTKTITVTQEGKYLQISKDNMSFTAEGGSEVVTVTTDGTFSSRKSDSWITVTTSGNKLTVTAAANTSSSSRSGTVTVELTNLSSGSLSRTIAVSQSGASDISISDYEDLIPLD